MLTATRTLIMTGARFGAMAPATLSPSPCMGGTVAPTTSSPSPQVGGPRSFSGSALDTVLQSNLLLNPGLYGGLGVVAGAVGFALTRYQTCQADQYLIRTGPFIKDMLVSKQGFQWPFQLCQFVNMHPNNYSFDLHAMSSEKLELTLPTNFTIGPKDDPESIKKYARFLDSTDPEQIMVLVKEILEGETRIQSASMTLDQIFNDRKAFKEILIQNVQKELDQFGLEIYNANIKELQDSKGSEYFEFLRQKKRSQAENSAKIDIAEAKKVGDIGQAERMAITRQQTIQIEADTVRLENIRKQEMVRSNAELAVVAAEAKRKSDVANIEGINAAKIREADLQQELERRRIAMETEKLRATDMSKAQVRAEIETKTAEGLAAALRLKADAELYSKQQEAAGLLALYQAQADGVSRLTASFNGDGQKLIQYLMLDRGLYERLAETNAKAINGLNPKITVWQTGEGSTDGYSKPIADVLKMVPPLLTTIQDQTGMSPPNWLASLAPTQTPSLPSRLQE